MYPGSVQLVGFGAFAVLTAFVVLTAMVHYELAPAGGLGGRRQWMLTAALGTGVLAFAFKLALIVAVIRFPGFIIAPHLIDRPPPADSTAGAVPWPGPQGYAWVDLSGPAASQATEPLPGIVWEALPDRPPEPSDNPTTADKVLLGRRLFFDRNLSRDRTLACSSCHDVETGAGVDGRATSVGIDRQVGTRNAPTVWNAAFQSLLFWDGRAPSLEAQATGPLVNPVEMGMPSLAAVERRVAADPAYSALFARAFGDERVTIDRIAAAIAAYERTLVTPDTPYDRFVKGDPTALTPAQVRGMALFASVGCINCHSGPNFGAGGVADGQTPLRTFPAHPSPYETRYGLTRDSGAAPPGSRQGVWRIPPLRNVALTGPWLHNGAVDDLAETVRIMASAQLGRTGRFLLWSERERTLRELDAPALDEEAVQAIVAFLHALSSDRLTAAQRHRGTH